jgi:plastocyanin
MRRLPALMALGIVGLAPAVALGQGPEAEVAALDDVFRPADLRVEPGTTVTWSNDGRNPHTVTADDEAFDSGNLDRGDTFSFTFPEPGRFSFHCRYHGAPGRGMAGQILVGGVEEAEEPQEEPVAPPPGRGATLRVPADHSTIQDAVDTAAPGDLVLVSPGVYRETVRVTTPFLTIRGTDRNRVIVDGELRREKGVHIADADGVTVENMTARRHTANGFYWTGVDGYRGSYLTAYNNGDYGIYAFGSVRGQFDHSYASGHPDSGFYIGQCDPCHALVIDVLAERNGIGWSGTNASGDLILANSEWRFNHGGLVPNTLDSQILPPQRGQTIVGNWIHHNNNPDAPSLPLTSIASGMGVVLTGVQEDLVLRNRIEGHHRYGVVVAPMIDRNLWLSGGNRVEGNVIRGSGIADLAMAAPAEGGNRFCENDVSTSVPPAIELLHGCGFSTTGGGGGDLSVTAALLSLFAQAEGGDHPQGDWRTQPEPPPQPNMPAASTSPPAPATDVPRPVDLTRIEVPPQGPETDLTREVTVLGVGFATSSWWSLLISVYAYVLPLALYATWIAVGAWDLTRREDLGPGGRIGWLAAILLLPLAGPVAYYAAGRSPIPASMRAMLVGGGLLIYVLVAGISYLVAAS